MIIQPLEPKIQPEAKAFLKTVKGKIAVIVLVGKYRTGKSLLLNHLSGQKGFGVGHTTNAMTQGLNILPAVTPAKLPNGENISVLWVDTEGIWDTDKNGANDMRIFTLSCLLGSHVILNIMRNLGSENLEQL